MLESCRLLKFSLLLCLPLSPASAAFGFCFQPNPTVSCEFLNSDAVFTGRVISVRAISDGQFTDSWYYKVQVEKRFRGPRTPIVEVYTGNDSGRFPLQSGDEYLLFAQIYKGQLEIDNCGNSALLSAAINSVKQLEKLKIPKDAEIEGRISFSGIPDSGTHIAGVGVIIHGQRRSYSVVTDKDGWFRLHVSPGKYSAEIQEIPHWNIVPYDLSIDNPSHFIAKQGRCVGLQFVAADK